MSGGALGSTSGAAICLDQRVRKAAAELIGNWAQGFAFTKVLIGSDGKFGNIEGPAFAQVNLQGFVCRGTYQLSRTSPSGASYALAISDIQYRVELVQGRYNIALVNLPDRTDTDAEAEALVVRFTVNGRPYREILEENRAKLNAGRGR